MLNEIFKSILIMSFSGSMIALFWLIAKPLTRNLFSPRWQYYIWLTVLIVMIVPISALLPEKAQQLVTEPPDAAASDIAPSVSEQAKPEVGSAQDTMSQISSASSAEDKKLPEEFISYCAIIWLTGAAFFLILNMTRYILFIRTLDQNSDEYINDPRIPKRVKARRTDMLDAPVLVGLFRPALYLPAEKLGETSMNYILMHEIIHYKRHDILYKWTAMTAASLHWFNPLVYIVIFQIDLECEVSCDFEVTNGMSEAEKNDYMNMILNMLSISDNRTQFLTTQMAGSKKILMRRFNMIKKKKITNKIISFLSVLIAITAFSVTVFAGSVMSDSMTENYTINIIDYKGNIIPLDNKPFVENGLVYVPLREMFQKMGYDETNYYIKWDNGDIRVAVMNYPGESGLYKLKIGDPQTWFKHVIAYSIDDDSMHDFENIIMGYDHGKPHPYGTPVLKNSITYMPLRDFEYMIYRSLNKRDENKNLRELKYEIYDKSGNLIVGPITYHDFMNEVYGKYDVNGYFAYGH
ncbi:MAG: hypothetical protein HFE90_00995 [Firmicutes bacterium]|nr:hypothetical protein [Bacillota bacterium]